MKFIIKGSVNDRGRYAEFETPLENPAEYIGKRISAGNDDVGVILDAIAGRLVKFRLLRGERVDCLSVRPEESVEIHSRGNAYDYCVQFSLEE